jgi:hypothetical protein
MTKSPEYVITTIVLSSVTTIVLSERTHRLLRELAGLRAERLGERRRSQSGLIRDLVEEAAARQPKKKAKK